jgi:hypothetical protein
MPAATPRGQWTLRRAVARRPDTLSIAWLPGGYLVWLPRRAASHGHLTAQPGGHGLSDPTSDSYEGALNTCAPILKKAGITFPDPSGLPPLPEPGKGAGTGPGRSLHIEPGTPGDPGLPSLTTSGSRHAGPSRGGNTAAPDGINFRPGPHGSHRTNYASSDVITCLIRV